MGESLQQPAIPYQLDPSFQIHVRGRLGEGGIMEIHFAQQRLDMLDLPPAEMAVVALLLKKAQQATDWAEAFLTPKALARLALRHAAPLTDDAEQIPGIVYQLRKRLERASARRFGARPSSGREFARRLLETHRRLGYRLSLPADNLHLHLLQDDLAPTQPPASRADAVSEI